MKPLFKGKHFITLEEWTKPEIDKLLEVSKDLKKKFYKNEDTTYLKNKNAFLMFFEQSTRTRNS
ncbi:MAG: ornithine carbamoyltransferase, partial [Tenericutes bacterium HGW-Tenericutes-5]